MPLVKVQDPVVQAQGGVVGTCQAQPLYQAPQQLPILHQLHIPLPEQLHS